MNLDCSRYHQGFWRSTRDLLNTLGYDHFDRKAVYSGRSATLRADTTTSHWAADV